MKRIVLIAVSLVAVSAGAAQPVAAGQTPRAFVAEVAEGSIVPGAGIVAAGRVRFDVRNIGEDAHQVTLVRTGRFAAELRLQGDHAVVRPLAVSAVVVSGERTTFTVVLRPGSYVLLDNLPWNYWRGTAVAFTVR